MKTCSNCKQTKNLLEFYKDKTYNDGHQAWCKACTLQRRKDRAKGIKLDPAPKGHKRCNGCKLIKPHNEFYADKANKTDGRYSHCIVCKDAATKRWREQNKNYYNKSMREYRAKQDPEDRRDIDLKSWFGLPYGWYKSTLEKQGNVCAICKKTNTAKKRCFAVDHHHASGIVRGIICYNCNRLLHAFDNVDLYESIMAYLKLHKEKESA